MLQTTTRLQHFGTFRVADVAREAEVTPATIRYYARVGLLRPDREPDNGYRCFSAADLRRVEFIRHAQAFGLTIGDIKSILEIFDHGESPCCRVRSLVKQRLANIQERIAGLQATEARINVALSKWSEMRDVPPESGEICPLIERVDLGEDPRQELLFGTSG